MEQHSREFQELLNKVKNTGNGNKAIIKRINAINERKDWIYKINGGNGGLISVHVTDNKMTYTRGIKYVMEPGEYIFLDTVETIKSAETLKRQWKPRYSDNIKEVKDHFNLKPKFSYTTFNQLVKLNEAIMAIRDKYEEIGDGAKIFAELSICHKNQEYIRKDLLELELFLQDKRKIDETIQKEVKRINQELSQISQQIQSLIDATEHASKTGDVNPLLKLHAEQNKKEQANIATVTNQTQNTTINEQTKNNNQNSNNIPKTNDTQQQSNKNSNTSNNNNTKKPYPFPKNIRYKSNKRDKHSFRRRALTPMNQAKQSTESGVALAHKILSQRVENTSKQQLVHKNDKKSVRSNYVKLPAKEANKSNNGTNINNNANIKAVPAKVIQRGNVLGPFNTMRVLAPQTSNVVVGHKRSASQVFNDENQPINKQRRM